MTIRDPRLIYDTIADNPADPGRKLPLIDLLVEYGQEEIARLILNEISLPPGHNEAGRSTALLQARSWWRQKLAVAGIKISSLQLLHGVPHSCELDPEVLCEHGDTLFSECPARCVRLMVKNARQGSALFRLFDTEHIAGLHGLDVLIAGRCGRGDDLCRRIQAQAALRDLRELRVSAVDSITPKGVESLAQASHLGSLRHLQLRLSRVGDAGAQSLAASPMFGALEVLDLASCIIGPAGAEALAGSTRLDNLRELILRGNFIGDAAAHFAQIRPPALEVVDLRYNGVPAEMVSELSRCERPRVLVGEEEEDDDSFLAIRRP